MRERERELEEEMEWEGGVASEQEMRHIEKRKR